MERNIQKNGLVNLVVAVLIFLAGFGVTVFAGSLAGQVTAIFLGLGVWEGPPSAPVTLDRVTGAFIFAPLRPALPYPASTHRPWSNPKTAASSRRRQHLPMQAPLSVRNEPTSPHPPAVSPEVAVDVNLGQLNCRHFQQC